MELYSDTYYIHWILAGDTACFACLLDRYSRPIHALIYKVTQNAEDAEELAQDAFLKAYTSLASFKGECSFSTWLYRIAYNTALSAVRKKKHEFLAIEESALDNVSEEEAAHLLDQEAPSERVRYLEAALGQLPPDERALLLLFYWKERTIDELAGITGLTTANVKVRLHRIRKKLYVLIKRMEDESDRRVS